MTHPAKVKMARKMRTRQERKTPITFDRSGRKIKQGVHLFETRAWSQRNAARTR